MRKSKYPEIANTLGQKIRKKRMDLGKSLLDVAGKADITESYLSRIEADKQVPLPEVAEQLEKVLGVQTGEFVSYTLPKYNTTDPEFFTKYKLHLAGLKQLIREGDVQLDGFSSKDKKKILESWERTYKRMASEFIILEKVNKSQKFSTPSPKK